MDVVPSTMAMTAGMEIGKSNSGSISSRLRVRTDIAAKVVKHYEQRRHQRFEQADEYEVAQSLREEKRVRRCRRNAIGIEHLIAQLARPCLIQRDDGGEQKRNPHQAANDMPRLLGQRIERKAEDHHHEQRKKQHGIERVFRTPLQANVFFQRCESHRPEVHDVPSRNETPDARVRLAVRSTIWPASIHINSSATPSSNAA